ncbi:MAG: glycosyltransferase [Pseudomonadota bacterium]
MIFATVGTQLPFDRLLGALDVWASRNQGVEITAQSGVSSTDFKNFTPTPFLSQPQFEGALASARVVVAHAGMGTILSAAELGKPVVIMPRRAELGEHRNDHQLATAAEMARLENVTVAQDAEELAAGIDRALAAPALSAALSATAPAELIDAVSRFIAGAPTAAPQARPVRAARPQGAA